MYKNILWDFDGVILNSMQIRDWGFKQIFMTFSSREVDELIKFHQLNGGLSRYVKIRYFFEKILKKTITDDKVNEYAIEFSMLMKQVLTDQKNLIMNSVNFIRKNYSKFNFHIVSGSDQKELKYLCKKLDISDLFISINGSPTNKEILIEKIIIKHRYKREETYLIGDSINDLEAAKFNKIQFYGYNNPSLNDKCKYIVSFSN